MNPLDYVFIFLGDTSVALTFLWIALSEDFERRTISETSKGWIHGRRNSTTQWIIAQKKLFYPIEPQGFHTAWFPQQSTFFDSATAWPPRRLAHAIKWLHRSLYVVCKTRIPLQQAQNKTHIYGSLRLSTSSWRHVIYTKDDQTICCHPCESRDRDAYVFSKVAPGIYSSCMWSHTIWRSHSSTHTVTFLSL